MNAGWSKLWLNWPKKPGIGMPEVGIFPAQQSNAFATGWNRNNALVAVSAGLLQRFDREQARAVLAHEIGHVANGDMITLSLIQGVINTFVMFFARLIGFFVDRVILKNERGLGLGYWITTIVAEIFLGILASTIVMWFSRQREFRADAAGASLAGRGAMISALQKLQQETASHVEKPDARHPHRVWNFVGMETTAFATIYDPSTPGRAHRGAAFWIMTTRQSAAT